MQSFLSELETAEDFNDDFEQDITEEDKTYIFAVTNRLSRILNWDPGDDDVIFEKQSGPQVVREALLQYFRWKIFINESGVPETPRMQHLVTYSLAKLCFYYWIRDSNMVADILREVFECDGHFSSMFAHIVNRHDRRSLWRQSTEYSRKREDSATVYFVHHAYKTRLRFNGFRFVDMPLQHPLSVPPTYLATIYNRPHLLLHLLRYGAKVEILPNRLADNWNLSMLLRHLVRILWNSLGEDLQNMGLDSPVNIVMSNTMHDVAECLRILLRVISQIRLGELNFLLMKFNTNGILSGSFCSHEFIRLLSRRGLVPKFVNRYLEPPDMQHLCRCVIRDSLNRTWNLPYGVHSLPLPKLLKRYLSLSSD